MRLKGPLLLAVDDVSGFALALSLHLFAGLRICGLGTTVSS